MSDELPKGWASAPLVELAEINPRHPKGLDDSMPISVRMAAVSESKPQFDSLEVRTLGEVRKGFTHFAEGDVVFAKITPCMENGKGAVATGLQNGIGCGTTELHVIRPLGGIDPHYVYRFLAQSSVRRAAKENFTGTAGQARVPTSFIEELELPLAPLAEQRRIVAKLEKLLGQVDACQQRLVKLPTLLKRFRQSILAVACSGRLTADWREENPDAEPATELFVKLTAERERRYEAECKQAEDAGKRKPKNHDTNKRSRNLVNNLPDVPETWGYYRLEELCHLITDGTHKTPQYQSKGVPFLSVKNVRPFLVRDADIKFISEEEHQWINSRCNPESGDILYTKVGATFGYAAVVELDYKFSIFVSLALLKPVNPFFSSAFAELLMNSELIFQQARERISGSGTPDLHLVEIRDFRAPLPPLAEQQEIVRRVEGLFALADQLELRLAKARGQVDKLTPSLLARAFAGKLVPQDPTDEPAEKLLARIKASP
jgi:type I restriction enzyme S subunit